MKRYQLYLNPHSVAILDDFEKTSNISRSKIIRHVIDRFVEQLSLVVSERKPKTRKKYIMDSLVGFVDLKTDRQTNFAQNVDEIYFTD